ncbi:MAG TPA: efflux RND transporter permease subunit [Pirellulales bacterium]
MFSHFFIDRPIFATVLSIVVLIVGLVAIVGLPVAQYPEVAPPVVQVSATYHGANAKTVADIVAIPIEQEVNGVENMLYMSSRSTNDGQLLLDVTFKVGTNLDMAQVLVQNRVSIAEAKLPDEVKRLGVTTKKKSPAILMCVNIVSPDQSRDQLYLSNFALREIKDELARVEGVGDVSFLCPRDYSMRIWLDPEKLASKNLTAGDVIKAVSEQNNQVAAGRLGQPPVPSGSKLAFQLTINTQGRLVDESEFGNIIVKTGDQGQNVFLLNLVRDTTRDKQGNKIKGIELGAKNYDVNSYLDGKPAVTMAVFQLPGSNALKTAEAIREKMRNLSARFPAGVAYQIHYDTTVFVDESIHEVFKTLIEAFVLVFIVVLVFLQDWRATVVPMIAVPVSLIGTFAVMGMLGFSLNNLSLFGLVLAIGIVVDDAIVVVENVERYLAMGLDSREAARRAMTEVAGPVIAIALVLSAVFIPTAFMAGISGEFFKQFALTIAASTIISAFNSLTLSPALCAILFKGHGAGASEHAAQGHGEKQALPRLGSVAIFALIGYFFLGPILAQLAGMETTAGGHAAQAGEHASSSGWIASLVAAVVGGAVGWALFAPINRVLAVLFGGFNRVFDVTIAGYGKLVSGALRISAVLLLVYCGFMGLTYLGFQAVPVGFIPDQDKGYLVVNVQLPDGATLERCDAVVKQLSEISRDASKIPGVAHTIDLSGYSILLSTNISNVGGMFVILEPFEHRKGDTERSAPVVAAKLRKAFSEIRGAKVAVFGAPAIDGLGTTGGFKKQVQDLRGAGLRALHGSVQNLADEGNADPGLVGLFSSFSVDQPQLFVEIDREKLKSQKVSLEDVNRTLQTYLGSMYVNDFTQFNRNWQVNVQAEPKSRLKREDIGRLEVRNANGKSVPLSTLIKIKNDSGPAVVNRYNSYPSAELNGNPAAGVSSGQATAIMDKLSKESLPDSMGSEWTEITLQQLIAEKDVLTKLAFPLAVVFVFLVLSAQYESWSLPVSIILIVPMCLLASITGIWLVGMDNNIFTQIGLVVLIGLAAKNAILIVEFAKQRQDQGLPRIEATIEACRLRLRPILMTSFAFILGVVPLVLAKGAGAEMRTALGVAVFSGMLGVTLFGLVFTPVFYAVIMKFAGKKNGSKTQERPAVVPANGDGQVVGEAATVH